ncbi:MAG: SDR family oxidoreductase, partial [Nitrospiraceae bacterium]|nr:SDR family oxidoreductase [Nitrospiraceae bacterium]
IALGDMNLDEAAATAGALKEAGADSAAYGLDVSSAVDVEKTFEAIKNDFGRLDILINNAGITRDGLVLRMKPEDWDAVINVNLRSVFLCSKEAVKIMSRQRYGRIVSIASVVAFMGNPGQANYGASKAGIVGLTKTIAKEYAGRGITANAVAPGFIVTAMTEKLPEAVRNQMLQAIPSGKFGTVQDVAHAVSFFCSPGAGYITGQVMHVNGGMYM